MAADQLVLTPDKFVIQGVDPDVASLSTRKTVSYWSDAWRRFRKNPVAVVSFIVLILMGIMCVIGPNIRGYDYITMNLMSANEGPSSQYWFGTDALGRDLFSRIWVGARVSIIVAICCSIIQMVVGCIYGGIMAYFGGIVDEVMMRILEIINSVPSLLITLIIMMVLGNSMWALLLAMCITSWVGTARQMRGLIKQLRETDYVAASECLGTKPMRIILRHLIPNTISILLLELFMSIPQYIFTEASLSFLGMGLKTPNISLGTLIADAQAVIQLYPYELFFPAAILVLIVLAFNLFGDGLRDALDPQDALLARCRGGRRDDGEDSGYATGHARQRAGARQPRRPGGRAPARGA